MRDFDAWKFRAVTADGLPEADPIKAMLAGATITARTVLEEEGASEFGELSQHVRLRAGPGNVQIITQYRRGERIVRSTYVTLGPKTASVLGEMLVALAAVAIEPGEDQK